MELSSHLPHKLLRKLNSHTYFVTLCHDNKEGITREKSNEADFNNAELYKFRFASGDDRIDLSPRDFDTLSELSINGGHGINLHSLKKEKHAKGSVGYGQAMSIETILIPEGLAVQCDDNSEKVRLSEKGMSGRYFAETYIHLPARDDIKK